MAFTRSIEMNAHDTNNLMFLLNMPTKQLKAWYMEISEDDRLYAEELLEQAHLVTIDAAVAKLPQYAEANKVLDKFRI
jgi:hypothetical protein